VITDTLPISITNIRTISSGLPLSHTNAFPYMMFESSQVLVGEGSIITITAEISAGIPASIITNMVVITTNSIDTGSGNDRAIVATIITNTTPIAYDDYITVAEDIPITIEVLTNDTDANNDDLFVTHIGQTSILSSQTENLTYTVVYTPARNFNGSDSFTYNISDIHGASTLALTNNVSTATVHITVTPINDMPTISDMFDQVTHEDMHLTMTLTISDVETAANDLILIAESSQTDLVAHEQIAFDGTGMTRTMTITPTTNMFGMTDNGYHQRW